MSRNEIMPQHVRFFSVAPREGRVSRNRGAVPGSLPVIVAPREGRVSRNRIIISLYSAAEFVAPREGRVSRNVVNFNSQAVVKCRAPRGACE